MKKYYKKLLTISAISLGLVSSASAQCDWTLDMTDSWGDGWNGNQIEISINGVPTNYTLSSGSNGSQTITVNDNDVVVVTYLGGGSFNSEVGFTLTDNNTNTLASASNGPTIGNVYWQGGVACVGGCEMPTSFTSTSATISDIDIEWTSNGAETSWILDYGVNPSAPGSGTQMVLGIADVTISGSTISYTISGLTHTTDYSIFVAADCGGSTNSNYALLNASTLDPCPNITGLVTTYIDNDSIGIDWTSGGSENSWNIEVGAPGFTPGTGAELFASNSLVSSDTIGGLDQITNYEVYVMGDCGSGFTSEWVGPLSFTSLPNCSALTNFVATVNAPDEVELAWTPGSTGETEWYVEYGAPGFTMGTGTGSTVMTNPTTTISGLTQNTTYSFYVRGVCSAVDSSLWVGPETVTTPLFCNNVSGLSASTVVDTAFLSWTAGIDGETEWNVEYGPLGFTLGTGTMYTTTENNADTLVGLVNSSVYQYYVQAACASGDTSLFTGPFTFTMPLTNDDACDAIELFVDGVTRSFTSSGSTSQGEPINGSGGSSVWFYFEHPASNGVKVSLCGSLFDTKVYGFAYDDCNDFSTYSELAFNDDACGLQSEIELCGNQGDIIAVMVDGFSGASGNFVITLTEINLNAGTNGVAEVCASDVVDLETVATVIDPSGTWFFSVNPNALDNNSELNLAVLPVGQYTANYVVSQGCAVDTVTAIITSVAAPQSGVAVDPFVTCNTGDVFLLDGLSGTIQSGGTWSDDSGTGLIGGQNSNIFVANGLPVGSYPFTYTVDGGVCPDASTTVNVTLANCVGVEENSLEFSIFPNPNNGTFNLVSNISERTEITITDVQGKVVYNNVVTLAAGIANEVEINNVVPGMYIVKITSNDNVATSTIVVQ